MVGPGVELVPDPVTGERTADLMSEEQEIALGQKVGASLREHFASEGAAVDADAAALADLSGMVGRITGVSHRPGLPWRVHLVESPDLNAFATACGLAVVLRGLYDSVSEDELAGVIGHEVAHVCCRHILEVQALGTLAMLSGKTRKAAADPWAPRKKNVPSGCVRKGCLDFAWQASIPGRYSGHEVPGGVISPSHEVPSAQLRALNEIPRGPPGPLYDSLGDPSCERGGAMANPKPAIQIFVDFWNVSLNWKDRSAGKLDWKAFPSVLLDATERIAGLGDDLSYSGMRVYASHNPDPTRPNDTRLKNWLDHFLDRQPGVSVHLRERRAKRRSIRCRDCGVEHVACPSCSHPLMHAPEKGVDTAIVTDMLSLAWEGAYQVGILVSSDGDFVPAVERLQNKGLKIVNATWAGHGHQLAKTCWASFKIDDLVADLLRPDEG